MGMAMPYLGYSAWYVDPRSTKEQRDETTAHRARLNLRKDLKEDRRNGFHVIRPAGKRAAARWGARPREQRTRRGGDIS